MIVGSRIECLVGSTLPAMLDLSIYSVANADSCNNLGFDGE